MKRGIREKIKMKETMQRFSLVDRNLRRERQRKGIGIKFWHYGVNKATADAETDVDCSSFKIQRRSQPEVHISMKVLGTRVR